MVWASCELLKGSRGVGSTNKIVEQRRHKRFRVPKGSLVGLGPHNTKAGQIIDVSMGGLGFRYAGSEEPSNGELDIVLNEREFFLGRMPFKTVSDFEMTSVVGPSSITMRRSGVEFRKLTEKQRSQLRYFIQKHTLGEA